MRCMLLKMVRSSMQMADLNGPLNPINNHL